MVDEVELHAPVPLRRPPPMPTKFRTQEWWIGIGGEAKGPFSQDYINKEVLSGFIVGSTPVANVNDDNWVTASEDPIISSLLSARASPPSIRATRSVAHENVHHSSLWVDSTSSEAPQPSMSRATPSISAERGATVVNVVNQIETSRIPPITGDAADKSPGLALFLSLLIVGLGQLYNGDFAKGIGMFFLSILLWAFFLGWLVNIWSMIDAYSSAKSKRHNYNLLRAYAYR